PRSSRFNARRVSRRWSRRSANVGGTKRRTVTPAAANDVEYRAGVRGLEPPLCRQATQGPLLGHARSQGVVIGSPHGFALSTGALQRSEIELLPMDMARNIQV